ncbi:hypothetical protein KPA97_49635, partial [Burkholderia cenocepacia]|nr:hypothetical protein [Burkholderia cenocepacia]MDR5668064.1 hypothetical protein [Burkholderia cenocepacia]
MGDRSGYFSTSGIAAKARSRDECGTSWQSFFYGSGCNARLARVGNLLRAGDAFPCRSACDTPIRPDDHRGSVSEEPFIAKEVKGLWVANTRPANEISELCREDLSSSSVLMADR